MADRSGVAESSRALFDAVLRAQPVRERLAAVLGWGMAPVTAAQLYEMSESSDLFKRGIAYKTVRLLQEWCVVPPFPVAAPAAKEAR